MMSNSNNTSKANILSSKALAYLNSKKTNSILKSYEDAISSNKFVQNQIKVAQGGTKRFDNPNAINSNERG
jgi:hypothetical protein